MHAHYMHLAVADVRPGMVLSTDLLDESGQVLLPQGTILTDAMIAALPRHDVAMLAIARVDPSTSEMRADQDQRAAQVQRIARLFRLHNPDDDSDWATGVLRDYVLAYRVAEESGDA